MDPQGNQDLANAISAAATPLGQLKTAGEGVISNQGHSFADLGLPDDFDTQPANCTAATTQ